MWAQPRKDELQPVRHGYGRSAGQTPAKKEDMHASYRSSPCITLSPQSVRSDIR